MSCEVLVKAANGNISILFNKLLSITNDASLAHRLYIQTMKPEFKQWFSNSTNVDINNEPSIVNKDGEFLYQNSNGEYKSIYNKGTFGKTHTAQDVISFLQNEGVVSKRKFDNKNWVKKGLTIDSENELAKNINKIDNFNKFYYNNYGAPLVFVYKSGESYAIEVNDLLLSKLNTRNNTDIYYSNLGDIHGDIDYNFIPINSSISTKLTSEEENYGSNIVSTFLIAQAEKLSKLTIKNAIDNNLTIRNIAAAFIISHSRRRLSNGLITDIQNSINEKVANELISNDLFWSKIKSDVETNTGYVITDLQDIIQDLDDNISNTFDENAQFRVPPESRVSSQVRNLINSTSIVSWDYKVVNGEKVYNKDNNTPGGFAINMRFSDVSNYLIQNLSKATSVNNMFAILDNISKINPSYSSIITRLKTNKNLSNAFFLSFKNESPNRVSLTLNPNAENAADKLRFDINNLSSYTKYQVSDNWMRTISMYKLSNFYNDSNIIDKINNQYKLLSKVSGNKKIEAVSKYFNLVGLNITDNTISKSIDIFDVSKLKVNSNITKDELVDIILDKIYKLTIRDINKYINYDNSNNDIKDKVYIQGNLLRLADYLSIFYYPSNNSYINVSGNQEQTFNKPTYLGDWFDMMNDDDRFLDHLKKLTLDPAVRYSNILIRTNEADGFLLLDKSVKYNDFIKNPSQYLDSLSLNKDFYVNPDGTFKFNYEFFDGVSNLSNNKGLRYGEISPNDWSYINIVNYFKGRELDDLNFNNVTSVAFAKYSSVSPADKNNNRNISMPRFKIHGKDIIKDLKLARNSRAYKAIYNIFKGELNRITTEYDYVFDENGEVKQKIEDLYLDYHYKLDDNKKPVFFENGVPTGNAFKFYNFDYNSRSGRNISINDIFEVVPDISMINDNNIMDKVHNHISNMIMSMTLQQLKANRSIRKKIFNDVIKAHNIQYNHAILEYTVNRYISLAEMSNLFMGSVGFYGSAESANKRATQLLASGNINGACGTNETFKGATIHDRIITNTDFINNLRAELKRQNTDSDLIDYIVKSYTNIKSGDAQSYITLDEYIRRLEWFGIKDKYKSLIESINDTSKPISISDLDEFANALKNFYYSYEFDGIRFVPNQVKNSEQVLIPRFIVGTELGAIYDAMVSNNISQLNFLTGEKVGAKYVADISDENGSLRLDVLNSELIKASKDYYYRNLRKQQDAVNHIIDTNNKLGVQIAKKIIDNISDNNIVNELFSLYVSNINESSDNLLKDIGITVNDDGTYNVNKNKLSEILLKSGISRGLSNNILKGFHLDEFGEFKIPLDHVTTRTINESILNSLFTNNVINQKFPGIHGAQMSNAFMRRIKEEGISKSDDLKHSSFTDNNGNITYTKVQVKLPAWSKSFFGSSTITIEQLKEAGLDTMIGYRIPTEDKHSIVVFEVVEFLDSSLGSTIVVPTEFIAQTGSDFDFDTIYTMSYHFRKKLDGSIEKIEYNAKANRKAYRTWIRSSLSNEVNDEIDILNERLYNKRVEESNEMFREFKEDYNLKRDYNIELNNQTVDTNEGLLKIKDVVSRLNEVRLDILSKLPDDIIKVFSDYKAVLDSDKVKGINRVNAYITKTKELLNYSLNENTSNILNDLINIHLKELELYGISKQALDTFKANYLSDMYVSLEELKDAQFELFDTISDDIIDAVVNELKLTTYEEFETNFNNNPSLYNSRKARDNRILDIYIQIMSDPSNYIESVTPSGFDDIIKAKTYVNNINKINISNNYMNPYTQDLYRKRALAGRKLKGLSVNRDSFISIAQRIGLQLKTSINYTFNTSEYSIETLNNTFGSENVEVNSANNTASVSIYRFGNNNSNTFTNIDGKLITSYSAQATANILDNVKFPLPDNVNDITFKVWKLLPELGLTWKTSTLLISQEAISILNEAYDTNNSINNDYNEDVIKSAKYSLIKRLLVSLVAKDPNLVKNIIGSKKTAGLVNNSNFEIYRPDLELIYNNFVSIGITLSDDILSDNLKQSTSDLDLDSQIDYLIGQIKVLDYYNKLNNIATQIDDFQSLTSYDKKRVGPEYNDIYNNQLIKARVLNRTEIPYDNQLIVKDGRHYYDAIYDDNSLYPPLKSYYEKGYILSDDIFSNDFITNSPPIRTLLGNVKRDQRNRMINYTFANIISSLPFFQNTDVNVLLGTNNLTEDVNLNEITPDNISKFENLSLSNKLLLVKKYYNEFINKDNILYYINPILDEAYFKTHKRQGINFIVDNVNDTLINSFMKIWYNKNPYYHLLAKDLVKYSYFIDGFNFGRNISKAIPTEILFNEPEVLEVSNGVPIIKGIGYTSHVYKQRLSHFSYNSLHNYGLTHRIKFARSNYRYRNIVPNLKLNYSVDDNGNRYLKPNNTAFEPNKAGIVYVNRKEYYNLSKEVRQADVIVRNTPIGNNKYTQQYYAKIPVRVMSNKPYTDYYYVPVNKLEAYEFDEKSRIEENNVNKPLEYYLNIIERQLLSNGSYIIDNDIINEEESESNNEIINNTGITPNEIYDKLGDKTQSENVVIDEVNGRKYAIENKTNLNTFTNHSGGAIGSDTQWDIIGKVFGMVNNKHYYFKGFKTPNGNTEIPINLKNEADEKLKTANQTLGRKFPTSNEYVNNLLRRNWWQVKNSDAVFAISSITDNKVNGGTGWAVHMAIAENKPVYVFDQIKNKWFTWKSDKDLFGNTKTGKFIETGVPTLTKNFAGVGTREINDSGKQAIRNVYEKSTQSSKPIVAYRTRGNNFLEAFEKDNAIGNPFEQEEITQEEYNKAKKDADSKKPIAQNFFDGYRPNSDVSKVHTIRPEITAKYGKGVKTFTLVKEGVRTRTTRLANWMRENNPKVGDYFWQVNEKNPNEKVLTRITAVYGKSDTRFKDNWFKEGWVDSNFNYVKNYDSAIEFEVIGNPWSHLGRGQKSILSNYIEPYLENELNKYNVKVEINDSQLATYKTNAHYSPSNNTIYLPSNLKDTDYDLVQEEVIHAILQNIYKRKGKRNSDVNTNYAEIRTTQGRSSYNAGSIDGFEQQLKSLLKTLEVKFEKTKNTLDEIALKEIENILDSSTIQDIEELVAKGLSSIYFTDWLQTLESSNKERQYESEDNNTVWSETIKENYSFFKETELGHLIYILEENLSSEYDGKDFIYDKVDKSSKNQYGLYKTNTVKEAVEEFIAWMIGEKHTDKLQDYRQAIIDKIPEMKGKTIHYKDLGEPSHATALDYLINKYNWNQPDTTTNNESIQGTLFSKLSDVTIKEGVDFVFEQNPELANQVYEALEFQSKSIKQTFKDSLFRGQEANPNIDKNGNLILSPTYDSLFKSEGVSFAENIDMAQSYGERYSKNPFIIEINEDYVNTIFPLDRQGGSKSYGKRVVGDENEQRFITKDNIIIPKGQYKIIKKEINYDFTQTSTLHLVDEWAKQFIESDIAEFNRYGEASQGYATNDDIYYFEIEMELNKRGVTKEELLFLKPYNPIEGDYIAKDALGIDYNQELSQNDIDIFLKKQKELQKKYYDSKLDIIDKTSIIDTKVSKITNRENKANQITPQQKQQALQVYSQYLDTIFPDSKVRDILLHGSPETNLEKPNATWKRGFYATAYNEMAKGAGGSTNWDKVSKIYRVLVNAKNPRTELKPTAIVDMERNPISYINERGFDSFIINNQSFKNNRPNEEVVVFEPEQIHILGSKQDIQKFKDFIKNTKEDNDNTFFSKLVDEDSDFISYNSNIIKHLQAITSDYNLRVRLFGNDKLLQSTVKILNDIDYGNNQIAAITAGIRADAEYAELTILNLEKRLYNENGYISKKKIEEATKNLEARIEFTTFMNYANLFLKGLSRISNLQTIKKDNITEEEEKLNQDISRLINLAGKVNELKVTHNTILSTYFEYLLTPISTNPEIKLGIRKIFDIQDDETKMQLLLDGLIDTNHSFIANYIKDLYVSIAKNDTEIKEFQKEFMAKINELGGVEKIKSLIESDNKLIQEFDNKYKEDHEDLKNKLYEVEELHGKYSTQYYKAEKELNKWRLENLESEEVYEVELAKFNANDILNSHIPARKAYDVIKKAKSSILSNYNGISDYSNVTKDDNNALDRLAFEEQLLINEYDINGVPKTGEALQIAKVIKEYKEAYGVIFDKYYEAVISSAGFNELLKKYKTLDTPEARNWLSKNTKVAINPAFWTDFEKVTSILEKESNRDPLLNALKIFKDSNGIVIGNAINDTLRAKIKKLNESRVDGNETVNPKAIVKPKNDNHYTDDYYKQFEDEYKGEDSIDNDPIVIQARKDISNILTKYINSDGLLDTASISIQDIRQIKSLEDNIKEASIEHTVDLDRQAFNTWFNENHDSIFDNDAFKKAEKQAKANGDEYYAVWKAINTQLHLKRDYFKIIDSLKDEYGLNTGFRVNPDGKSTITNINLDFVRSKYKVDSFKDLPKHIKDVIKDKKYYSVYDSTHKIYTLAEYMKRHKILRKGKNGETMVRAYNKLNTPEENINAAVAKVKKLYDAKLLQEKNKPKQRVHYEDAFLDLHTYNTTPEYKALLEKHGKWSEWYLDNHIINHKGEIVPAHYWVMQRPKDNDLYQENAPAKKYWGYSRVNNDKYVHKQKSEAKKWSNENVNYITTPYYKKTLADNKANMKPAEFAKWYEDNHFFNPYTNKYEPISIWTTIMPSSKYINETKPISPALDWDIKDEYKNENYRAINDQPLPKKDSKYYNKKYDTVKDDPMYSYLDTTMKKLVSHFNRQSIIDEHQLPIMYKNSSNRNEIAKNLLRKIGWFNYASRELVGENQDGVRILNMPFVSEISNEELIDLPKEKEFGNREEYLKRRNEVVKQNNEIKQRNAEYNKAHMDNDWINVLNTFAASSIRHKFIYEREHEMKLVLEQIRNLDLAKRRNILERLRNITRMNVAKDKPELYEGDEAIATSKGINSNLELHFRKFMDMVFYGEFEADEGTWTKIARVLQNYTSAKGMWLNAPGAFNNIAYGKAQMAIESWSGYYYTQKDAIRADAMYMSSIFHMLGEMGKDKSTSLTNALIKRFEIVELQDELAISNNKELDKSIRKQLISTNSLYFMHHIGEHYMQNNTLLAMLHSNRIINGEIKSFTEYTFDIQYKALHDVLDEASKHSLDKFIRDNKYNDRYLDGKGDLIRDFILEQDSSVKKEFLSSLKGLKEQAKAEFYGDVNNEGYQRLIDVFELKDGYANIKDGVVISSDQIELFKLKVIKVNQKLHGIYNKFDAGTMQNKALGRSAIQFKKWMRPGFVKRFGTRIGRAHWNESRNELDRGMYVSTMAFLTKPIGDAFREAKGEENMVFKALGNVMSNYKNYISNIGIYWHTLTDSDKANIRRTAVETLEFIAASIVFMILRGLADGEDDDKKWAYLLYSTDRLKTEILAYNPLYGFTNETRKLLRDPLAVMSTLDDVFSLMWTAITERDEKYKGGVYHGESKLEVKLYKNIPLANRVLRYRNIQDFAGYYKLY